MEVLAGSASPPPCSGTPTPGTPASIPWTAAPALLYRLMGVCFECLMEIDGELDVQTCLVTVREGGCETSTSGRQIMDETWICRHRSRPRRASAACCAPCGLDVTLVDEQAAPGGQLFRNIETPMAQALLDPKERAAGLGLVKRFRESGDPTPGHHRLGLEPPGFRAP